LHYYFFGGQVGTFGPKKIPLLGEWKTTTNLVKLYKHTTDLKNVPRNKKKEGKKEGHQVGTN
jgi:hypothetical protein